MTVHSVIQIPKYNLFAFIEIISAWVISIYLNKHTTPKNTFVDNWKKICTIPKLGFLVNGFEESLQLLVTQNIDILGPLCRSIQC